MAAGVADLEDEEHEFNREEWLAEHEPHMRARFEKMFEQQEKVDGLLEQLAKERLELEQKYMRLCGAPLLAWDPWRCMASICTQVSGFCFVGACRRWSSCTGVLLLCTATQICPGMRCS